MCRPTPNIWVIVYQSSYTLCFFTSKWRHNIRPACKAAQEGKGKPKTCCFHAMHFLFARESLSSPTIFFTAPHEADFSFIILRPRRIQDKGRECTSIHIYVLPSKKCWKSETHKGRESFCLNVFCWNIKERGEDVWQNKQQWSRL